MRASFKLRQTVGGPINDQYPERQLAYWLNREGAPLPVLRSQLSERTVAELGPKRLSEASEIFLFHLGSIVDAWIGSGRNGESDSPTERRIGPGVTVHGMQLAEIVEAFLQRNPIRHIMGKRVLISDFHPKFDVGNYPFSATEQATYWFLHALDSPTVTRLAKCDKCGVYFCYSRNPRRSNGDGPFRKNGTFCSEHRTMAAASRSISCRDNKLKKVIGWAADSWPDWTERKKLPLAKWVAARVNEKIGSRWEHIGGRWVSEHRADIERELARRVSATR